jgi:glycosyltransferase involved in cell wall biosynthesis
MGRPLDIVLVAEKLLPPVGGAERFALELLEHLARGHRVRALAFDTGTEPVPPPAGVRWMPLDPPTRSMAWPARLARLEALGDALAAELSARRADVVVGQLEAGPAAISAAREAGGAGVLLVQGYEALCHWAFGAGSECLPETRCRRCPRVLRLPPEERPARWAVRDAHDESLAAASLLVAPSEAMADACQAACGRRPRVAAPVGRAPAPARAAAEGHVAAISSLWTREKGAWMLAPIAARLPDRRFLVQVPPHGIPEEVERSLRELPNVTLRPPPAEIGDVLDGAALLVIPSQLPEPYARVAFESQAAGVPVVASDAGGLRESVPEGQRVAPVDDPAAWERVIRALGDPDRWSAARERGLDAARHVLEGRSLERIEAWLAEAAGAK